MSISTITVAKEQDHQLALVKERAEELMALVKAKHPEARFIGPRYWTEEDLWLIDAYFEGEDFELQDRLSERETDILLDDDIWLCTLFLPLDAFSGSSAL
jgi:hypothetical protein